jgi:hypothetical protein
MARGQDNAAPFAGAPPATDAKEVAPIGLAPAASNATPQYYNYTAPAGAGNRIWVYESSDGKLQQAGAQLSRESEELVSRYSEASDDEQRQKIKAQLAELVARQFNLQQRIREDEVAQIEARVKKLRALIEKRKAAQQSIIENRLDQLLREAEGLGWTPPAERDQRVRYIRPTQLYSGAGAAPPVAIPAPPRR